MFNFNCELVILAVNFILYHLVIFVHRFNEFGDDGGLVARSLAPKFKIFSRHVSSHAGFQVPPVEVSDALLLY